MGGRPIGGMFTKPYSSKIPFYYEALFEAGIFGRLVKEKELKRNLGREPAREYITLDFSNKMTMLLLYSYSAQHYWGWEA